MMSPVSWVIAMSGVTFVVADWIAAHNKRKGDTASEFLRMVAGVTPVRPWRPLGITLIIGACGWLAMHLITGKV